MRQHCNQLQLLGLPRRGFAEVVAVLRLGSDTITQPLGVRLGGSCMIEFRVFPLTRLWERVYELTELCLAAPLTGTAFAEALKGEMPALTQPQAISTPCPSTEYAWRVEAIVASREPTENGVVKVLAEPVYIDVGAARAYRRSVGCLIEALIAYTRAQAAAKHVTTSVEKRDEWCRLLKRYWAGLELLTACVGSTAEHDEELEALEWAVKGFARYALLAGCPPEG